MMQNNYNLIQQEIISSNNNTTIIAVSKNRTQEEISSAISLGITHFGESYINEAMQKWEDKPKNITLHMIGKLQSNKIKKILSLFDVIHSIESEKNILTIAKHSKDIDIQTKKFFIQVKLNIESQKNQGGASEEDLPALLNLCKQYNLNVIGLMCIHPEKGSKKHHPYYAYMYYLKTKYNLPHLSMGMSDDYKEALTFGSTFLRVGSILFNKE